MKQEGTVRRLKMFPVPQKLDISPANRGSSWEIFKQSWNLYEIATGLREKTEEVRVATLLSAIGSDALQIFNAFVWCNGEHASVETILRKFDEYCQPKRNVSFERHVFMSRKQKKNEMIDDYVLDLRKLARNCNYGQLTDSIIRDMIIMGVRDQATQESLLRENDPSLNRCIDVVRASERAHRQVIHLNTRQEDTEYERMEVDKVYEKKTRCGYCGKEHASGKKNCPAFGKSCNNCGLKNHFERMCRHQKRQKKVAYAEMEESDDEAGEIH